MTGVDVLSNGHGGWLVRQLPAAMSRDQVIAGFVRACEEIADSVRDQVADLEYELDVTLATPEMLAYIASWLGVEIDAVLADAPGQEIAEAQRRLVDAVSKALVWRGTRRGLEALLTALTDGRADVRDSGGIFGAKDKIPPADDLVVIELDHTGPLSRQQIDTFIADELPVGVRFEVRVRSGKGGRRS